MKTKIKISIFFLLIRNIFSMHVNVYSNDDVSLPGDDEILLDKITFKTDNKHWPAPGEEIEITARDKGHPEGVAESEVVSWAREQIATWFDVPKNSLNEIEITNEFCDEVVFKVPEKYNPSSKLVYVKVGIVALSDRLQEGFIFPSKTAFKDVKDSIIFSFPVSHQAKDNLFFIEYPAGTPVYDNKQLEDCSTTKDEYGRILSIKLLGMLQSAPLQQQQRSGIGSGFIGGIIGGMMISILLKPIQKFVITLKARFRGKESEQPFGTSHIDVTTTP